MIKRIGFSNWRANERPSDRANLYGYYQSQMGTLTPALNYPDRLRAIEAEDIQGLEVNRREAAQGGLNDKVIIRTFKVENIDRITINGVTEHF